MLASAATVKSELAVPTLLTLPFLGPAPFTPAFQERSKASKTSAPSSSGSYKFKAPLLGTVAVIGALGATAPTLAGSEFAAGASDTASCKTGLEMVSGSIIYAEVDQSEGMKGNVRDRSWQALGQLLTSCLGFFVFTFVPTVCHSPADAVPPGGCVFNLIDGMVNQSRSTIEPRDLHSMTAFRKLCNNISGSVSEQARSLFPQRWDVPNQIWLYRTHEAKTRSGYAAHQHNQQE